MIKPFFLTALLFLFSSLLTVSYASKLNENLITRIQDRFILAQSQKSPSCAKIHLFSLTLYGGVSYKQFPNNSQTAPLNADGGYYDIFNPTPKYSPYFSMKFEIRPLTYFSIAISYWNTFKNSSGLSYDPHMGAPDPNGQSDMSFSGINFYTTIHLPVYSIHSDFLFSAGPSVVFSTFSPKQEISDIPSTLDTKHRINVRPFFSLEYKYQLSNAFTLNTEIQYIYGLGHNIWSPYSNASYVPNMFNLSIGIGYQFL
ncbi:hypothetical protein [Fangia hongkongensis]|uniref:hypothetical protein n=1 Tax=Fangia hongkongensis TaxID=270495 RepID=UPI0003629129|nr:hypothetical protein [Fangia hongkongensis]MBK2124243.1 hypothetical protein [Fangia hongkongensis]